MLSNRFLSALAILVLPATAVAGTDFSSIPEPETLALVAVGAIALVIARSRGRK